MGFAITMRSLLSPFVSCALIASLIAPAHAQTPLPIGSAGMPGGRHTAFSTPRSATLVAGGAVELAHTESVLSGEDRHERIGGEVFGTFVLHPAILIAASALARVGIARGPREDHGVAMGSALTVRGRHELLAEQLHVGGELRTVFPPAESPGRGFKAVSPELRAIATYLAYASAFALNLGYRFDGSARAIADPDTVSDEGLLLASASSANAFLLSAGATRSWLGFTWVVEWSYDLAVGADAPKAFASPMRFEGSLQRMALPQLAWGVHFGLSPSARPTFTTDPLVRIEPRVWLGANVAFVFDPRAAKAEPPSNERVQTVPEKAQTPDTPPPLPEEPALPPGQIRGRVRSLRGPALRAEIEIAPLGLQTQSEADGSFAIDVAPGDYEVTVRAKGHVAQTRTATVEQNGVTILVIDLERTRP
jgi:hypothetical protein